VGSSVAGLIESERKSERKRRRRRSERGRESGTLHDTSRELYHGGISLMCDEEETTFIISIGKT